MKRVIGLIFLSALLFSFGCAKKTKVTCPEPQTQQQEQVAQDAPMAMEEAAPVPVAEPTPMELYAKDYAELPTQYQVAKGDCLWWIAEFKQIYNDPFMWPLIYKANRDKINNPDLIYPNQIFSIPRDFSLTELTQSRKQAGAAKPYIAPQDANLPANLRAELGWGF
ncbi:LysM peptidoglycan-binding domain-containing protein [Desulfoplanes formicivorans]|uniref:Peptidoglycan-binding protein n=1 Tax=Desulfoplanes formicivorans TaxID=1592317 RepID=A0A194AFE0_9BACT|nr:LysM peptidoglycan-binding domain-containing protein [Desulfoplanes formicivorans]GAU08787.1 peptidoglycan-binding protein [Desulfoplanes formicivorans]